MTKDPMPKHSADTILYPQWLVPVEPHGVVLENYAVVLRTGKIEAVLPVHEANEQFDAAQRIALPEHALIPGLVNAHTHAAMSLLRGLSDDLALMKWLTEHIWPTEAKHVAPQFVYDGTLLACAEMLRAGVTCFNDMYFFPEATAQAALKAGMRATIGMIAIEFASNYAANAEEYLHKGMATRDEFRDEALLTFCFAPHAPYTVTDRTFEQIATFAAQLDVPIHTHVHETLDEIERSLLEHRVRPLARLKHLDLLGPNLIAVHAVHLNDDEIELLAEHGVHVAHCPSSNLKLASGFARTAALLKENVNVGLGTDGAASNNRLDLLQELRLAALLGKAVGNNPEAVPAAQALRMATLDGARALGLDAHIGAITPGRRADLTALDLSALETNPCYDVISQIVYAAGREHVTHVWVEGELLLQDRKLTRLDPAELRSTARQWRQRISL
jgi:5-methylthioadenosine/S-adenosylhomocysteine deaminase